MNYLNQVAFCLRALTVGYKGSIEDIFYDYKDDNDLSFDIYCGTESNKDVIYCELYKLSGDETKFKISHSNSGMGHFIVTVELLTLVDKNDFITALRLQQFNPNGG